MVISDRTKGCCSSDLNEPPHPNHDQFAELDAHNCMGGITEIATGAPGYSSVLPNTISPLARTLKLNGYSTAQFGKCHEVPVWESSAPPLAIILPSLRRTRFCGRWLGFAGDRKVPAVANSNKPEPEAEDRARKSPKEGPRVRRLTAGGRWIRTAGSGSQIAGAGDLKKARTGALRMPGSLERARRVPQRRGLQG